MGQTSTGGGWGSVWGEFRDVGETTPVRGSGDTNGGPFKIPSLLVFFLAKINSPPPKSVLLKSPILTETMETGTELNNCVFLVLLRVRNWCATRMTQSLDALRCAASCLGRRPVSKDSCQNKSKQVEEIEVREAREGHNERIS